MSAAKPLKNVVLRIKAEADDRLKIVWRDERNTWSAYELFRRQVQDTALACRMSLQDLAEDYLDERFDYSGALQSLAKNGSDLYYLLFEGSATGNGTALKVKDWLASLEQEFVVALTISADSAEHVPWHLVFSSDPEEIPKNSTCIEHFNDFWAFKYNATVLYSGMQPKLLMQPRPRGNFRLLSMFNESAFEESSSDLGTEERNLLSRFLGSPEGYAFSTKECIKKWQKMLSRDALLNLYAHATGRHIELSEGDRLNIVDFRKRFIKPRQEITKTQPEGMVFLNGCNTAVGDLDSSFLVATAEAGLCGFVGAEAPLPSSFALRFGLAFLQEVVGNGRRVGDVVCSLRRQHWPLGLIYGCYCHPEFHVEADDDSSKTQKPGENFSYPRTVSDE